MKERIQHKIDSSENWDKAKNFIPLKGELILYSDLHKIKIGDGVHLLSELEFWENTTIKRCENDILYM